MTITVYLTGGMGNQMFHWAAGRALAYRLGTNIDLDISSFDSDPLRVFSLHLWKGVMNTPTRRDTPCPIIRDYRMPFNPLLFESAPQSCSICGHFQTEKYFSEVSDLLREDFTPREELPASSLETQERIQKEGSRSVFICIRRGDYVGNDLMGLLPMDYYQRAASIVAERVGDPYFFVFSDEPEWCRQYFKLPYRTVVAGNFYRTVEGKLGREDAELTLMRQCRHAILANSSYPWWGAFLGDKQPNRLVIAPNQWFGPASSQDSRDIIPERWIRI